ncbi:hypothetical protein Q0F99_08850 [Rathayibacter oskolensis]|uniref:hypothetical protein n=1 Tax=Rathayibacter oskolensis TaxID=1891671 RepID=UPI00265E6246|nr:hypothetical protein [Rathayibacter oskolensis]WKK72957.1 hypothetical protein Q0F99_08850 [Rathayibacter oskolensis]
MKETIPPTRPIRTPAGETRPTTTPPASSANPTTTSTIATALRPRRPRSSS